MMVHKGKSPEKMDDLGVPILGNPMKPPHFYSLFPAPSNSPASLSSFCMAMIWLWKVLKIHPIPPRCPGDGEPHATPWAIPG